MKRNFLIASMLLLLTVSGCATTSPDIAPSPPVAPTPASPPESEPPASPVPEPASRLSPSDRVPRITIEELLQKMEGNANILIVDTRKNVEEQFEVDHIKGAVPAPLSRITGGQWVAPADKEIILYCS